MVRIGILWPEIGILRCAGDGHALEVSLACRAGLALDMWTLTLVKLCDFSIYKAMAVGALAHCCGRAC